jgi:hypothetical protein
VIIISANLSIFVLIVAAAEPVSRNVNQRK